MKIVLIDKKGASLEADRGVLRIGDSRIPMHLTDFVILSTAVSVELKTLHHITEEGIGILSVDSRNRMMLMRSAQCKNGELKAAQYEAFAKRRLPIAKAFVASKITKHIAHIATLQDGEFEKEKLRQLDQAQSLDTLLGIEGSFTKRYFEAYFSAMPKLWHKGTRTKQPPRDPLNALLSFCYMTMYYRIASRLIASGFEPAIGYLHTPFRSHYALASDMMEHFRADINAFVHQSILDGTVALEDFGRKNGKVYLRYEGRKRLWRVFTDWMQAQESILYNHIAEFKRMIDEKAAGATQ